jgi:hypothetical protein
MEKISQIPPRRIPELEEAGVKVVRPPDPEVIGKKSRRNFTAKYKLRILAGVDSCSEPGQVASLFVVKVFIPQI